VSDTLFDVPDTDLVEEVWDVPAPAATLTPDQRAVLDFEQSFPHWKYAAEKWEAVRVLLKMTQTRYVQLLIQVKDCLEALAEDPLRVNRLRRIGDTRLRQRERSRDRIAAGVEKPRYIA
jgi:hypothetical protein